MYANFIKRILDFLLATIGFLVLLPFFILITLFLAIANNGNPFFIQRRPGFKGKIFSIIKFKTMNDKKDSHGNLLPDVERITRVGGFVRNATGRARLCTVCLRNARTISGRSRPSTTCASHRGGPCCPPTGCATGFRRYPSCAASPRTKQRPLLKCSEQR